MNQTVLYSSLAISLLSIVVALAGAYFARRARLAMDEVHRLNALRHSEAVWSDAG